MNDKVRTTYLYMLGSGFGTTKEHIKYLDTYKTNKMVDRDFSTIVYFGTNESYIYFCKRVK